VARQRRIQRIVRVLLEADAALPGHARRRPE